MNKIYFLFILLIAVFLIPTIHAVGSDCLTPYNPGNDGDLNVAQCTSGYLSDESGWCNYIVNYEITELELQVSMLSGNRNSTFNEISYIFDENSDQIKIWVDKTTVPIYIICGSYDDSKNHDHFHFYQEISLGKSSAWLPENVNYDLTDKSSIYSKWLFGLLFMLIGAFIFMDAWFNNRFNRMI